MTIQIIRKPVHESKRRAQVRAYFESRLEALGNSPSFQKRTTFEEITNIFYENGRWYGDYMVFAEENGHMGKYLYCSQTSATVKEMRDVDRTGRA